MHLLQYTHEKRSDLSEIGSRHSLFKRTESEARQVVRHKPGEIQTGAPNRKARRITPGEEPPHKLPVGYRSLFLPGLLAGRVVATAVQILAS